MPNHVSSCLRSPVCESDSWGEQKKKKNDYAFFTINGGNKETNTGNNVLADNQFLALHLLGGQLAA